MTDLIVLGRIDESFHQVAAAVVEEVLVRLGHAVQVREGPHSESSTTLPSRPKHLLVSRHHIELSLLQSSSDLGPASI